MHASAGRGVGIRWDVEVFMHPPGAVEVCMHPPGAGWEQPSLEDMGGTNACVPIDGWHKMTLTANRALVCLVDCVWSDLLSAFVLSAL